MQNLTKSAKRAHDYVCSLLTSGYKIVSGSETIGYYKLRHDNGNVFVIWCSANEIYVTKNSKKVEI